MSHGAVLVGAAPVGAAPVGAASDVVFSIVFVSTVFVDDAVFVIDASVFFLRVRVCMRGDL
jgi:hypothetical protein